MPSRRLLILLAAAAASALALAQSGGRVRTPAPVKDYTVSFFSDAGFPWVRVLGGTADLREADQVTLGDTIITVYSGLEDRTVESTITSPLAILTPDSHQISGPDTVRLEQNELTLTGEDWTYEYLGPREHRVHLRRNARIVFNAPLADLIK